MQLHRFTMKNCTEPHLEGYDLTNGDKDKFGYHKRSNAYIFQSIEYLV